MHDCVLYGKTDAHGIQTSVVQTTPPAAQTSMPAAQTEAPSAQTEVPGAQTAAPSAQTEAPSAQTAVPSAQTEAPSIQTVAPAVTEYEENILHEDTFTVSKTSYSILLEFESLKKTVYDFRDSRNYGIAVSTNGFQLIDFEGFFGIRINTSGDTVTYSVYTHSTGTTSDTASIVLYRVNADENTLVKKLGSVKTDTDMQLSVKFSDGLYMLTATFTVGETKEIPVSGYLYVENDDVITCRLANISQSNLDQYIDTWNNLLQDTRELCLKCGYIFGLTTTNHEEMLSASIQSFRM